MKMVVNVASAGRFHAFDLASQMSRQGHLGRLYTAYPQTKVENVPRNRVSSYPYLMAPAMILGRRTSPAVRRFLDWAVIETFDRWLAEKVSPCDIFHCLSSYGLRARRAAKARYGALTVCDRGSSHIQYQDQLLAEEHDRHGLPYQPIDPRIVEKELHEYDESDLITVPSTFAHNSFVSMGVPVRKLAKIPYGVDLQLFRPQPKTDTTFRVIYVGSVTLRKGIPDLLQAAATLKIPNFELVLVGALDQSLRPFFQRYEGSFRYCGVVPRRDLFRYYSQSSAFVLASIQEGFGLVQAQAMACGLPVVATTNTGAEDLFTDGVEGFIVPIRDPEAIQNRILRLYNRPDLRDQMARAALDRVRSLGGWDSYGQHVSRVYADLLARKRN
jgi:glycosyltransferase involved in cell wall biosynthesis